MKPKQQTKQQLMKELLEKLERIENLKSELCDSESDAERYRARVQVVISERRTQFICAVVSSLLFLAVGLYTGHKITQRATPEKIYVGSDYRTGYETGFKSALKENTINTYANGYTGGFRDGNLGNKSKALNWQPKTVKAVYRQIHHIKGAERLRL